MLPIQTILLPTDFSRHSDNALRLACALARDYQARIVVLHVIEPPVYYGELGMAVPVPDEPYEHSALEKLHRIEALHPGVKVETRLADGFAPEQILRVAEELKADLIVIGSHGRSGIGRILMGSVAEEVLRHAPCPVLTIRTHIPTEAAGAARRESVAV